jgi:hypothetical protein
MPDRIDRMELRRGDRTVELFPPLPAAFKQAQGGFFGAGTEPRLAEMLRDPIVHLVMQRDRVSACDVLSLFQQDGNHVS